MRASIYGLAKVWGAHGAILGELAAEVVGLLVQAGALFFGHRFFVNRGR